jgi:hypothetical protein
MFVTQPRPCTPRALPPLPGRACRNAWRCCIACRPTSDQRRAAARRGELSYAEACKWAARFPDEVDLVDGEFWFISQHTPGAGDTP